MMGRRDTSGIIGSTENRWENHGTQWGIFQLARELIAGGYELLLKIHWNSEVFLFFLRNETRSVDDGCNGHDWK